MNSINAIALYSASLCTSLALAQSSPSPWILCTRDLELIETMIEKADEQSFVIIDEFGTTHSQPINNLFFAFPTATTYASPDILLNEDVDLQDETTEPIHFITLVDGQTISGVLHDSPDDDQIRYSIYAGLTRRSTGSIPLERIRLISIQPTVGSSSNNREGL